MVKCSSCGERLSPRAKFCDYCGQPQKTPRPPPLPPAGESRTKTGSELQEKFCFACGEKIDGRAEICPHCGVRQQEQPQPALQKRKAGLTANSPGIIAAGRKKVNAALLGFFLGGLGIHKFYLGYTTAGWITLVLSFFLLIFTCGMGNLVLGLLILIEVIIYLTKSNEQFYEEYILNKKEWF